jgi:hypothetical protein
LRQRYRESRPLPAQTAGARQVMCKVDQRQYPAVVRIFATLDKAPEASDVGVLELLLRRDDRD